MSLRTTFRLAVSASVLLALAACEPDSPVAPDAPDVAGASFARGGQGQDGLAVARSAHARNVERMMNNADVAGVGVGRAANGAGALIVMARHAAPRGIPSSIDGVPVIVEVTGDIFAIPARPSAKPPGTPGGGNGGGGGGGGSAPAPTSFFNRPVPIGVSTGNANECAAGTIGARVSSGSNTYALSNNHVFARENEGNIGETIYQPGRYDLGCATGSQYVLGTLASFQTIKFDGTNNTVDAALAAVGSNLGNATTSAGYGVPGSTPVTATVGMAVQKCGRTTNCTTGFVNAVSVTVNVGYSSGTARFVNQIWIKGSKGAFSKAGDSGSLIVTNDSDASPVGLLFAGGRQDTFANPIGAVLSALNVSIDGK
ncbi:MAG TPA: hypothetical protein VFG84_07830 [Gemmatimonadaceae bacterium]|nr:hypothetical protein [Gemmatimonadaceae bacterium]